MFCFLISLVCGSDVSLVLANEHLAPFAEAEIEKGHQVIAASFVTEESGTGCDEIS